MACLLAALGEHLDGGADAARLPLQGMMAAWEAACGPLDQYGMQYSRTFAALCNAGVPPAQLGTSAEGACGAASSALVATA